MINWNGWTGGAVAWLVFFVAILGESWILEHSEMETVTGFEISEMGAAVLPAAIEDQEAVVTEIRKEMEANERLLQSSIDKVQSESMIQHWRGSVEQMRIVHWQANRVLSLLKHLHQYSGQHVADPDYPPVPEAV